MRVTAKAVQIHGDCTREYPVERMTRDAKITGIYEGIGERIAPGDPGGAFTLKP
jgi:alkylation response protein AidB-like acyl-CoA dehydrogenase